MIAALAARSNPAPPAPPKEKKFKADPAVHQRGLAIYSLTCVACHGPEGKGVPGAFPPLDGSEWVPGDISVPVRIVIHGLQGPIKVAGKDFNSVMPPHVDLDDRKIADVLSYVRQSWSNDAPAVSPSQVGEIRARFKDRTSPWTAGELGR